jgi:hypothetical protein
MDPAMSMILNPSSYKAASTVSESIEAHFLKYLHDLNADAGCRKAPAPSSRVIEEVIDTCFWASLRKEEGQSPKISVAYLPPDLAGNPLLFGQPLPFTAYNLTKLAPGVERASIHLGIWHDGDALYIWGTTQDIPVFSFVLETVEPGLLVVKHRRSNGFGKFVNVAILKGDQVKIVDEQSARIPDCPQLLSSLLGINNGTEWNESVSVMIQLATSMRGHGKGGLLLVVPSGSERWRDSIVHPLSYPVEPPFQGLTNLLLAVTGQEESPAWKAELTRVVDHVAGLTAVDGAMVLSDRHELLAFGAKISRATGRKQVEEILMTEPVIGGEATVVHPAQQGGTRHFSAAQFVSDQRDAIALVASQDGRFTVFGWSPCEDMVHAHRIDSLLL